MNALILELLSLSDRFLSVYPKLLSQQSSEITVVENDLKSVETLCQHISQFIVEVEREALSVSDLKSALYAVFGTFQGNNASNFSTVVASAILSSTYLM